MAQDGHLGMQGNYPHGPTWSHMVAIRENDLPQNMHGSARFRIIRRAAETLLSDMGKRLQSAMASV
jgi:hypothetical protein